MGRCPVHFVLRDARLSSPFFFFNKFILDLLRLLLLFCLAV